MLRNIFLLITTTLVFAFTTYAQETKPAAKLEFEEVIYAFDEIQQGDKEEHVFKCTNTGDAPLVLTNIATSCGCTAPEWPREAIEPGESNEVLITFNSTGKMGIQNKVITVFSNAENPQVKLKITGNVIPKKSGK